MHERYCRIYWAVMDDPKFDGIREDMRHFGAWSLLLLTADMAWPASAFVPPTVPKVSLRVLQECGLVDALSGSRYRIHGLDAEREARSESARNAAAMRWHGKRNADGNAETMPSKAEQEQEQEQEQSNGRADALDSYWTLLGKYPNGRTKEWITELVNEFDDERVSAALAAESKGDRQGILSRVRDRLRSEADKTAKAKAAAETQRLEVEAVAKRITPEQAAENRRRVQEELRKMGVGREAS